MDEETKKSNELENQKKQVGSEASENSGEQGEEMTSGKSENPVLKIYPGGGRKIVLTAESVTKADGKIIVENISGISFGTTGKGNELVGCKINKEDKVETGKVQINAEVSIG